MYKKIMVSDSLDQNLWVVHVKLTADPEICGEVELQNYYYFDNNNNNHDNLMKRNLNCLKVCIFLNL
jgi:hypothetical protein